jgi:hypothetical protein
VIVPMKKVTLVVLDREREKALKALRKVGVLHVEGRPAESADLAELERTAPSARPRLCILSEISSRTRDGQGVLRASTRRNTRTRRPRLYPLDERDAPARKPPGSCPRSCGLVLGRRRPRRCDYLDRAAGYTYSPYMSGGSISAFRVVRTVVVGRDKKAIRLVVWGRATFCTK